MKARLNARLCELKTEFDAGNRLLAQLETQRSDLEKKLLRISGAIQVLEEELAKENQIAAVSDAATTVEQEENVI